MPDTAAQPHAGRLSDRESYVDMSDVPWDHIDPERHRPRRLTAAEADEQAARIAAHNARVLAARSERAH